MLWRATRVYPKKWLKISYEGWKWPQEGPRETKSQAFYQSTQENVQKYVPGSSSQTWVWYQCPVTEAECQQAMDAAPKAKMQCCEHSHPPVTGIYNIMNTNKLELKVELEGVVAHKVQSGLRSRMMKVGGYQVINLCLISWVATTQHLMKQNLFQ